MTLSWRKVCHAFTGYDEEVISLLAQRIACTNLQVFCSMMLVHLNLTWERAAAVLYPYSGDNLISGTWLNKSYVTPVLNVNSKVGNILI